MEAWAERVFNDRYPSTAGAYVSLPGHTVECGFCEGEGEYEFAIGQDSFGNWDTVTVVCEECEASGEDG